MSSFAHIKNRVECHKTDRMEINGLYGASNVLKQRQLRDYIGLLVKKIAVQSDNY